MIAKGRNDCKCVDMCVSCFGIESRTPFLYLEFAGVMERDSKRFQFDKMKETCLTKIWLRDTFDELLPESLVLCKKEVFSDGVMYHLVPEYWMPK